MDIDFKKLTPWNWFKKEQEELTCPQNPYQSI